MATRRCGTLTLHGGEVTAVVLLTMCCADLMDFVWATRRHQSARHLSVPQAVAFAQQQQQQSAGAGLPPIVMAEVSHHLLTFQS